MQLTITVDQGAVDGCPAARFVAYLVDLLASAELLEDEVPGHSDRSDESPIRNPERFE